MKAFIITMSDKPTSVELAKKCRKSVIEYCSPAVQPLHFEAVQPKGILSATMAVFGEHLAYTYPESPFNSHMDFNTNLYLKAYETNDIKKIVACSLSHEVVETMCRDGRDHHDSRTRCNLPPKIQLESNRELFGMGCRGTELSSW